MRALLITVLISAAGASSAQEGPLTMEDAIARTIERALPDNGDDRSLRWESFDVGGGDHAHWHLAAPHGYRDRETPPGVTRRLGWLAAGGRQAGMAACGDDEAVAALALKVHEEQGEGPDAVLEALADRAVGAELVVRREHARPSQDADPDADSHHASYLSGRAAYSEWRLTATGRGPGVLAATHGCTPPGTRSGTRCRIEWRLVFRPDYSADAPDAVRPAEHCDVPGV